MTDDRTAGQVDAPRMATTPDQDHPRTPRSLAEAEEVSALAANANGNAPRPDAEPLRGEETPAADDDAADEPRANPMLAVWPSAAELTYPAEWDDLDDAPDAAEDPRAGAIVQGEHTVTESIRGVIREALGKVPAGAKGATAFEEPEHVTAVIADALEKAYGDSPDILKRLLLHAIIGDEFAAWRRRNELVTMLSRAKVESIDLDIPDEEPTS